MNSAVNSSEEEKYVSTRFSGGDKIKGIKVISIVGIVFSAVTAGTGILIAFFGGMFLSYLTAQAEGGWGILGIPLLLLGVLVFLVGIVKLAGYVMLIKMKKSGWFTVVVLETLSLIYKLYFAIEGFAIFFLLPLIWSLIVIVYLIIQKKLFFPDKDVKLGKRNAK